MKKKFKLKKTLSLKENLYYTLLECLYKLEPEGQNNAIEKLKEINIFDQNNLRNFIEIDKEDNPFKDINSPLVIADIGEHYINQPIDNKLFGNISNIDSISSDDIKYIKEKINIKNNLKLGFEITFDNDEKDINNYKNEHENYKESNKNKNPCIIINNYLEDDNNLQNKINNISFALDNKFSFEPEQDRFFIKKNDNSYENNYLLIQYSMFNELKVSEYYDGDGNLYYEFSDDSKNKMNHEFLTWNNFGQPIKDLIKITDENNNRISEILNKNKENILVNPKREDFEAAYKKINAFIVKNQKDPKKYEALFLNLSKNLRDGYLTHVNKDNIFEPLEKIKKLFKLWGDIKNNKKYKNLIKEFNEYLEESKKNFKNNKEIDYFSYYCISDIKDELYFNFADQLKNANKTTSSKKENNKLLKDILLIFSVAFVGFLIIDTISFFLNKEAFIILSSLTALSLMVVVSYSIYIYTKDRFNNDVSFDIKNIQSNLDELQNLATNKIDNEENITNIKPNSELNSSTYNDEILSKSP